MAQNFYEMLREDERPGEEGLRWSEEEQPLVNTGKKGFGHLKQTAGQEACLALPCTDHCSQSCLLLKFHF